MGPSLKTIYTQCWPPRPTWGIDDIPDQTGRVHLVTGGAAGLGKETVRALLRENARVYVAARGRSKAEAAIAELKQETGTEAVFLELDLASLASIRRAAEEFLSKEKELHVLYNNAGVMFTDMNLLTADGYDLQFGTNVLGHYYLTELLLPALVEGAKSSSDGVSRVVNVSSGIQYWGELNFDTFADTPQRRKWFGRQYRLYAQSKFANVVYAKELQRRVSKDNIVVTSLNPGNIRSDLWQHFPGPLRKLLFATTLHSVQDGALTQLYAGTCPEGKDFNGQFLIPWARLGLCNPTANDPELGRKLWDWLEAQVHKHQA